MPQLFVGVWPSSDVQAALAAYPRPQIADVRWSTPSQWLVGVRPLGHVADAIVPQLIDTLRFELDGAPTMTASFGPVRRDGWLLVQVLGLESLGEVVFDVTSPLVPVTHPQPWSAQLVLARGKRVPAETVAPLTASWTVDSVSLARGTRTADGPGYEDIERFDLGDA